MTQQLPASVEQRADRLKPPAALIVTGMSGAGKSTALKALEDLGYETVDNLPLSLLGPLLSAPGERRLAIGIDTRTRAFSPRQILDSIAEQELLGRPIRILFLDCNGGELIRRFSETRRRHPLAGDRPAGDGVAREREMLGELRRVADVVIDTSDYSSNDLRQAIAHRFGRPGFRKLTLTLMSFGYARGVPRDADLVFDMRYLRNPHWVPQLRPLTGTEEAVAAHVRSDPLYEESFSRIMGLLALLLPGYAREGRAYVTIGFGCTGGRHRSVAVAEAAGQWLAANAWPNVVVHRDRGLGGSSVDPLSDVVEDMMPDAPGHKEMGKTIAGSEGKGLQ